MSEERPREHQVTPREHRVTWREIGARVVELAAALRELADAGERLQVYGIPRGGASIAALLQHYPWVTIVDDPEDADVFVDDLIDSGATAARYEARYGKPVQVLFDKRATNDRRWFVFPWEGSGERDAEDLVRRQMQYLGMDADAPGVAATPRRVVEAWNELFRNVDKGAADYAGMLSDSRSPVRDAAGRDIDVESVRVKGIPFTSVCERHLLPFGGAVDISYWPSPRNQVLGLSELVRLVNELAAKPNLPERLASEIADALHAICGGVRVTVRAKQNCLEGQGVHTQGIEVAVTAARGSEEQ